VLVSLDDQQLMTNRLRDFGETLGQQDLDPAQCFDGSIGNGRLKPADLCSDGSSFEGGIWIGRALFGHQLRRHQGAIVVVGSHNFGREPANHAPSIKGLILHNRTVRLPPERGAFHLQEAGQPLPRQVVERRLRAGQPLYNGWVGATQHSARWRMTRSASNRSNAIPALRARSSKERVKGCGT
jgi:hypothetical protein